VRIFLDANILFSAAKSEGAVRELVNRLRAQGHVLCADEYVLAEAERNLASKGAHALGDLAILREKIECDPFRPDKLPEGMADALPEKDRPVLAAAIRLRCHALVTGDRTHFGALYGTTIAGVVVHSPRSLAEAVLK
jgi:hypothetical protein